MLSQLTQVPQQAPIAQVGVLAEHTLRVRCCIATVGATRICFVLFSAPPASCVMVVVLGVASCQKLFAEVFLGACVTAVHSIDVREVHDASWLPELRFGLDDIELNQVLRVPTDSNLLS